MPVIGYKITKVLAERKEGKIEGVSYNLKIEGVKKRENGIYEILFSAPIDYGVAGKMEICGAIIFKEEQERDLVQEWENNKRLPDDVAEQVLNAALFQTSVQATILANTVRLLPPIQFPRIRIRRREGQGG